MQPDAEGLSRAALKFVRDCRTNDIATSAIYSTAFPPQEGDFETPAAHGWPIALRSNEEGKGGPLVAILESRELRGLGWHWRPEPDEPLFRWNKNFPGQVHLSGVSDSWSFDVGGVRR